MYENITEKIEREMKNKGRKEEKELLLLQKI